jgi:hypothetical protein
MINFRFHLISLIAVFLALGLGILVGSTVVDQAFVDRLNTEIKDVRRDLSVRNDENRELRDEITRLEEFMRGSSSYAVDDRLTDVPVAVIAERGVDERAVRNLLTTVRASGAEVPGVLWLDERWKLDRPRELNELQDAARVTGNAATARAAALRQIALRLAEPPPRGRPRPRDVIEPLRDRHFLELTDGTPARVADFPVRPARVLIITGTDSALAASDTMTGLVNALVAAEVPTVVAEVYDDHDGAAPEPQRGAALAPIRGSTRFNRQVATLDDAEKLEGQITAVVALEQVASGTVGHYGYGEGATRTLPQNPS